MKTLVPYKPLLGLLIIISMAATSTGQPMLLKTINVNKAYKVASDCNVEISNKYGHIHLIPWTKDSVAIDIILTARGSSQEKIDKMVSLIDFEFTGTRNYVVANTYFKDYTNRIITDINKIAGSLFGSGNSVEINYAVHLPASAHLKVENKFGNVYMTNHDASFILNLSNGDFKANDLKGDARINISFGNGNIRSIEKGTLSVNYSEFLDIQSAGDLAFDSRSSRITIGEARSINLNSRRDKYTIQQSATVEGTSSFSYINIYGLGSSLKLDGKYGSLTVQGIGNQLRFLGVISSYTDVNLYLSKGLDYSLELKHDKKTTLSLPASFNAFKKEIVMPDEGVVLMTGVVGDNPNARIRVDIKSGAITIIQK